MASLSILRKHAPDRLTDARSMAHRAVQLLTKAARANLDARADDSHSSLGWDGAGQQFVARPIPADRGDCLVALALAPLELRVFSGGRPVSAVELDGLTVGSAERWLDDQLVGLGLKVAVPVVLPYELPADAAAIEGFQNVEALDSLAAWFDLASGVLSAFAWTNKALEPGPGPVRCWPHHFDIATFVSLETGDPETARGVGVGLSPGDDAYDQPYVYVNPWPYPDAGDLPVLSRPGHWHTEGFVGAVATADGILSLDDVSGELAAFVADAFETSRQLLKA